MFLYLHFVLISHLETIYVFSLHKQQPPVNKSHEIGVVNKDDARHYLLGSPEDLTFSILLNFKWSGKYLFPILMFLHKKVQTLKL